MPTKKKKAVKRHRKQHDVRGSILVQIGKKLTEAGHPTIGQVFVDFGTKVRKLR